MPSPLVYKNGVRPEQAKDTEVIYLILGEMKYDEDCDPEKVWEIIDEGSSNLRILFDWLKNNYEWLDLDNTNIYVTEKSKEKEFMLNMKQKPVSAYDSLKSLQTLFPDDGFDIDEMIENNIY